MSIESIIEIPQPTVGVKTASEPATTPSVNGSNVPQIKHEVPQYTPNGSRSLATVSDFNELSDVLLGDEISMMGCDVDSWDAQSPDSAQSFVSTTLTDTQQHQQSQQPPFACPPAQLTRHTSLPVSMMRSYHAPMQTGNLFAMNSSMQPIQQQPMVMATSMYSAHNRQRNYMVHQQNQHMYAGYQAVSHHMPMMAHPMAQQPLNQPIQHKPPMLSRSQSVLEPIAFSEARMSLGEIDALALDMFAESDSKKVVDGNNESVDFTKSEEKLDDVDVGRCSLGGGQDLEKALNSLLPEMDQDLFQPSELNTMPPPSLVTPRKAVPTGRTSLSLIMSPNLKTMSSSAISMAHLQQQHIHNENHAPTPRSSPKSTAMCKVGGCERRVRSKGFCKTHGGGRKCTIDGCKKSSQNGEFCIGHGGGKKCRQEDCAKAAQSHGLCKAHGGGARCKHPNCNKSSQGGGLCRAHGGGKRCQALHCPKGAQRGNFCATHGGFRNCKIEGCVRTDRGGGFCEVHRRGRLCNVDGCKKLARNEGMCTVHIREEKQELIEDTTSRVISAAVTPRVTSAVTAIKSLAI